MADLVRKYADPRDSVRQQIAAARQRRATVNRPVNADAIPRGLVRQLANVQRKIQRRIAASQHRAPRIPCINTGAVMAQETKE